ncbi:hypothetical protein AX16_000718 [Volvariella volvacea WC 439]|nr:hypothetical protein AX16_000718 [Volvariella volvacea WC 439]
MARPRRSQQTTQAPPSNSSTSGRATQARNQVQHRAQPNSTAKREREFWKAYWQSIGVNYGTDGPIVRRRRVRKDAVWEALSNEKILTRIFNELLWVDVENIERLEDAHDNRNTLADVCSTWRKCLFGNPLFWNQFKVADPDEAHVLLVQLWLIRSGGAPLFFQLEVGDDKANIKYANDIMKLMNLHIARWGEIYLDFAEHTSTEALNGLNGTPGVLHTACLRAQKWPESAHAHMWRFFAQSPWLSSIQFSDPFHINPATLSLPWGQLTKINFPDYESCNTILNVVRHCTSLRVLCIRYPTGPMPSSSRPIILPHAAAAWITVDKTSPLVLTNFRLPKLDILRIQSDDPLTRNFLDSVERCMTESRCTPLSELTISAPVTPMKDLRPFLASSHLNCLQDLLLYDCCNAEVIKALTLPIGPNAKPGLFPTLKDITITVGCVVPDGLLGAMLWSRLDYLKVAAIAAKPGSAHGHNEDYAEIDRLQDTYEDMDLFFHIADE